VYLKRIDISGFKSFPDPTTVIFDRGITAVVGPNGCGKTNILDAIRWVLGEQRARLLRGGRMEEVIFSGTRQRPPLNLAEVTLVIDNRSGRLPVQYAEITVARRLFRSGESEYLLNNTPCRLKDISELLADTGVGSHSYSVIGQGMIDSLLSNNPEDRRFLFEEAAGVSKYKARKKEAENKLKATGNDLLRVHDIQNEVEKRVRELRVQMHRARRYQKISDQLAGIEWEQLAGEYYRSQKQLALVLDEYHTAASMLNQREAELTHAETDLEQLRGELNGAEAAAAELSEALNGAVAEAHQAETRLVRDRERREGLLATADRLTKEIAERNERNRQWTAELADLRVQAEESARRKNNHVVELQAAEARFKAEDSKLVETRTAREKLAEQVREGERAYGQNQADLAYRVEQTETLTREKAELKMHLEGVQSDKRNVQQSLEQCQSRKEALSRELETISAELAHTEEEIAANEKKTSALDEQLKQCENNLSSRQAQADTLAGIVARGEGLGRGTEAVLQKKGSFAGSVDGWVQRISAPDDKRAALEAALAGTIGALWCETSEVAGQVLRLLQENEIGQACLWDPSLPLPHASTWERPPVDDEGFCGWLIDECRIDPGIRPMAEVLLYSVILAVDSPSARRIFCRFSGEYTVVSLDGTAYVPPGLVYAGRGGVSVLGRIEMLAQLEKDITAENKRVRILQAESQQLQAIREKLEASADEQRAEKERLGAELNALEPEISRAQTKKTEAERRLVEFTERLAKIEAGLNDAEQRRLTAEKGRENWEECRRQLVDQLSRADEQLAEQEARQRAALNSLNEKRMAGVELSGKIERLNEEKNRKEDLLAQNSRMIEERVQEKEKCQAEQELLNESIAGGETSWAELLTAKDQLAEQRNAALAALDAKKEQFAVHEKRVRHRRSERDEAESTQHHWEMRRAEVTGLTDQLERRAVDRFAKSREELAAAAQELTDDRTVSDEDVIALKAKLERIGPVNLLALEEYEREKERLEFLNTQVNDLNQAKISLNKTISELNQTAGERFLTTFEAARLNFQSVFTDLFQGGEADVRLAEPDNPLESPIEIYARPRGKKALGIRHLSGGERALTAIGMLFGLYLVKPSPFCILDEIDAPLDDANTGRFLRLLERFKAKTQFVVITHNKLTMENADNLYGVTMEQPGVSRLVSVRLNPHQDENEGFMIPIRREKSPAVTAAEDG